MVREGERAPDFRAQTQGGDELALEDYRGDRHVVLYFFARDFTPG